MRMKIVKIHTLDELSPEARKAALEVHRDINVRDAWSEELHDDFTAELAKLGLEGQTFYWELDGQGRGIWCDDLAIVDLPLLLEKAGIDPTDELLAEDVVSLHKRGDRHKVNRAIVSLDSDHVSGRIENKLNALLSGVMRSFLENLDSLYTHLTSDEAVTDTLVANDYEFLALGDDWSPKWG